VSKGDITINKKFSENLKINAPKDKLICNRIRWYGHALKMFEVMIPKQVLNVVKITCSM
jgi:hypothetical protein